MECKVKWFEGMSFIAETGSGHLVAMDGAPEAGGRNLAPRPMEIVQDRNRNDRGAFLPEMTQQGVPRPAAAVSQPANSSRSARNKPNPSKKQKQQGSTKGQTSAKTATGNRSPGSGVGAHVDSYIGQHVKSHIGQQLNESVKHDIADQVRSLVDINALPEARQLALIGTNRHTDPCSQSAKFTASPRRRA